MFRRSIASAALFLLSLGVPLANAASVPSTLPYEGRMLNASGSPVSTAFIMRFSLWRSSDFHTTDTASGAINTGAQNYGGWQETQTVTPNSNGYFRVQLGSVSSLPTIDFSQHKYLQVEAKSPEEPDTSFVLLDPTDDNGADTQDRKVIGAVAYAKNAESIGGRTTGTASGSILILGPEGRVQAQQMGNGTTALNFEINASDADGDATLTFGNAILPALLKYSTSASRFEFSDDVLIQGNVTATHSISGSLLTLSGLRNCDSIDTDASGHLICGTDAGAGVGISQAEADARYVTKQGDTMTNALTIGNGAGLTASGSIGTEGNIFLNKDNAAEDAILSFGSDLGAKALKYSGANHRFEFDDSLSITGDLTVTGRVNGVDLHELSPLSVSAGEGLSVDIASGSYRLGNSLVHFEGATGIPLSPSTTQYVFFGSGGLVVRTTPFPSDASFIALAIVSTSATDILSIADRRASQSDTREHDVLAVLTPEYDKTAYRGDGDTNIGKLTLTQDSVNNFNYYQWTSSRPTLQDYDIFVRFFLPQDFVRWTTDGTSPIRLHYRSTSADASDNTLALSVFDTNDAAVTLSGNTSGLASLSWQQTNIGFLGSPTWAPGQEVTVKLHVAARNRFQMHIGSLEFRYTSLMGKTN